MHKNIVIVGSGHAGVNLAANLRKKNWTGSISLISDEKYLPYHRPPLSKICLQTHPFTNPPLLKPDVFYKDNDIDLIHCSRVTSIDKAKRTVTFNDQTLSYDKLILATGSNPLIPSINGLNSTKYFLLRTLKESIKISKSIDQSKQFLIIGGGFIGLEVAAALREQNVQVSIFETGNRTLNRVAHPIVSEYIQKLHKDKGVHIQCNTIVESISQESDKILLHTDNGKIFQGNELIIGTGSRPNIDLALNAGLDIDNGIKVNQFNQTSDPNIYAIGDCCNRYNKKYNSDLRLESIQNALDQAKSLSSYLCEGSITEPSIPTFWSDQYDAKLNIAGISSNADTYIFRKQSSDEFTIWYLKNDKVIAIDAINSSQDFVIGKKIIQSEKKIPKENISDIHFDLKLLLQ